MSHTNAVFALANTTSETQALDAGIIPKQWIEAPDSDDDESPLAAVLAECDEPSGQDACEDDSVEVKVMSLKEARAAAAELKLFLEENKRKSQDDMKKVCADLSRMTVTARHVQPEVSAFFGPAPANRDPV